MCSHCLFQICVKCDLLLKMRCVYLNSNLTFRQTVLILPYFQDRWLAFGTPKSVLFSSKMENDSGNFLVPSRLTWRWWETVPVSCVWTGHQTQELLEETHGHPHRLEKPSVSSMSLSLCSQRQSQVPYEGEMIWIVLILWLCTPWHPHLQHNFYKCFLICMP